jgi:hypothetical protein
MDAGESVIGSWPWAGGCPGFPTGIFGSLDSLVEARAHGHDLFCGFAPVAVFGLDGQDRHNRQGYRRGIDDPELDAVEQQSHTDRVLRGAAGARAVGP